MTNGSRGTVATFQRLLQLRRSPHVGGLGSATLAGIASHLEERSFPKGSVLLREGELVTAALSLIEGEVSVSSGGEPVGRLGSGVVIGARGLNLGMPLGVAVAAETDVSAFVFDAGRMVNILEDHFSLLHEIIRDAAHLSLDLRRRLTGVSFHPPEDGRGPFAFRRMDLVERIMFLRQGGPFAQANIGGLAELADAMRPVSLEPRVVLWNPGEPASKILLPVKGVVDCVWERAEGGTGRFRSTVGVPLGSRESVAGAPRWYQAKTETPVEGFELSSDELIDIFEDNFEMALQYLGALNRASLSLVQRRGSATDLLDFVAIRPASEDLPGRDPASED